MVTTTTSVMISVVLYRRCHFTPGAAVTAVARGDSVGAKNVSTAVTGVRTFRLLRIGSPGRTMRPRTNYCTTVKSSLSEPEKTLVNHNHL